MNLEKFLSIAYVDKIKLCQQENKMRIPSRVGKTSASRSTIPPCIPAARPRSGFLLPA